MRPIPLAAVWTALSRLTASDRFADIARVALSLIGVVLFCDVSGRMQPIVSLMLGVIACALAETDDSGPRRLVSLCVTLVCFAGTALIVEILGDYPVLFALGLVSSTFALSMLGAVGARWGSVATATLILAVYTMIGMEQQSAARDFVVAPFYLTLGAAWYGLFSYVWSMLAPQNAVRHALADVFAALAGQVGLAARLFAPYRETDYGAVRLRLAEANGRAVAALNAARLKLIDRLGRQRMRHDTREKLQLYFTAQDIHERIHSAHYPHEELAQAFFHSDLLFRCGHLLNLQARTLDGFARALRRDEPVHAPDTHAAMADVRAALDAALAPPPEAATATGAHPPHLIAAVEALLANVAALQSDLENPYANDIAGQRLQNPDAATVREALQRILGQLTVRSALFRHAVRLAIGLLAGYLVVRGMHLQHGFWILLTTLLVGQPGYGATRRRLIERIVGTVSGVVAGWAALQLFPDRAVQLGLIVVAGTGFFVFRRRQYPAATAMITLFVILSFEQILSGYAVIGPRLFDTLVGVAISFLALRFVLPDWKVRRLKDRLADMLAADARYLRGIVEQYRSGRTDDLAYRIVRRDAHNAHAGFEALIRDILSEPARTATKTDAAMRAFGLAHNLLSYLSALGAHRRGGTLGPDDATGRFSARVAAKLETLADIFRGPLLPAQMPDLRASLEPDAQVDDAQRLIVQHLNRTSDLCDEMISLGPELVKS